MSRHELDDCQLDQALKGIATVKRKVRHLQSLREGPPADPGEVGFDLVWFEFAVGAAAQVPCG